MARGEKLTEKNVKAKLEQRVSRAATAVLSLGKCKRWEKDFSLPKDAVNKGLDYLLKVIEQARTGGNGGFRL